MNLTKRGILALLCVAGMTGVAQAADIYVKASNGGNVYLGTSQHWTSNNVYYLDDVIYIGTNTTVVIDPGTVVRGMPDSATPGSQNPGALIVCRSGKLFANGTKEKPVIFTDMTDNNFPWTPAGSVATGYGTISRDRTEAWGGIVILGRAYIAKGTTAGTGPDGTLTFQAEGVNAFADAGLYGGANDWDCSGSLTYVSIRYGGFGLAPASEINGLTLCGVGRGTKIEHIEIVNNLDDGIEIFGGTVDVKWAAIINAGDDSFDLDQGWRGRAQFVFVCQGSCKDAGSDGSGQSDNGFEMDGPEANDDNRPFGLCRIENVTLVGCNFNTGEGFLIRENIRPQIFNTIMLDIKGTAAKVRDTNNAEDSKLGVTTAWNSYPTHTPVNGADTNAAAYYWAQLDGNQTDVQNIYLYNCVNTTLFKYYDKSTDDISTNGRDWNIAAELPIRHMTRDTVGAGSYRNVIKIDPRPIRTLPASPRVTPTDGFCSSAGYYGAFNDQNWLDGWSLASTSGLITNTTTVGAQIVSFELVGATTQFTANNGVTYLVQSSSDLSNWTTEKEYTATSDGTVAVSTVLGSPLPSNKFFRVILK